MLALQGDVREHLAAFDRAGAATKLVRAPEDFADIDALALPGGESTTMSRLLRVFGLDSALRERLDGGMPCFATCAGLILLSQTILDGRDDQVPFGAFNMTVQRNGWGRQAESFEADLTIPAIGDEPFHAVFIRAPRVAIVCAEAEVLATHNGEPVAVAEGPNIGLTFHPELTDDIRLQQLFLSRIGATQMVTA